MQNIMRNCNKVECQGGKGVSQPAPREMLLPRHLDPLHGAPVLPSTQKSPTTHAVPLIVLLPVLGKALRGMASRKEGS